MTVDPTGEVDAAIIVTFTIANAMDSTRTYAQVRDIMTAIKTQVGNQIRDGYILTGRQHLATIDAMTGDAIEPGQHANGHS